MSSFKFHHQLRVRYSEIDGQKLVFHGHYLTYFDCAMVEYFRECLKLEIHKLAQDKIFELALVKTTLEFSRPARLDDRLAVWCRVDRMGRSSLDMEFKVTREEDENALVIGRTVYVNFDPDSTKARPIPQFVRNVILEYDGSDNAAIE